MTSTKERQQELSRPNSKADNENFVADSSLQVVQRVIDACLEAKGKDLSILDVHDVFEIADYFIIVSGRSDRQTQGITNRILDLMSQSGLQPEFVEGYDEGHWVILDFSDVVVHVFYEPLRDHYDLEGLWIKAKRLVLARDKAGKETLCAA